MGKSDMIKTSIKLEGSHSTQLPPLDKLTINSKGN